MEKRLFYILLGCLACCFLAGCNQEDTLLFDEPSGVYFGETKYSYSFKDRIGVEKDTIIFSLQIFGDTATVDRPVAIKVIEDDTAHVTTANPERYRILSAVIPAGEFSGSVAIEVNDGAELADSVYTVFFGIATNDYFPEIMPFKNNRIELQITSKQIPPANWDNSLRWYFGEYDPDWWDFICEQTGKTSLPFWYNHVDQETWWMSEQEFYANARLVKAALKKHDQEYPDKPLCYENGKPWTVTGI